MLKRGLPVLKQFFIYLIVFILMKNVFILFHAKYYEPLNITAVWSIIKAGFSQDVSMASYLVALPLVLRFINIYIQHKSILYILKGYTLIISIILGILFVVDLQLYSYWGFRLDSTPLFYFLSSPSSALASATTLEYIYGLVGTPLLIFGIYKGVSSFCFNPDFWLSPVSKRGSNSVLFVFFLALCFLGIRGGWTVSTMNLSRAYFSTNERYNHAAINPIFSFMVSISKSKDFSKQYDFFDPNKAQGLVADLYRSIPDSLNTPPLKLINRNRPDIFLVILESFSIPLMEMKSENGKEITPNLNRLSKEGIFFSNFYANSFRTDRGLVSILSGFPAQPDVSIMKYPRKAQKLPTISKSLKEAMYKLHYFYGGDINFTNQNAYLKSGGYDETTSDKDFPISQKLSKWGVNDEFVFDKVLETLSTENHDRHLFYTIQTSTSHEPFDAPVDLFENPKENAFAYTDACIGNFIEALKKTDRWENSLVIFVADHQGGLPEDLPNNSPTRYHIPFIWTGGAISEPMEISTIGSQMDIAATLLNQLNIPTTHFKYSKNIVNPSSPHFAYFAFPEFLGLWNKEEGVVWNLRTDEAKAIIGDKKEPMLSEVKALLQVSNIDMSKL